MNLLLQIAAAFASVAVLLAVMALVRAAARRAEISAEVQRKFVHVCTGIYAMGLPWLFPDRWPVYMLVGLTLVAMAVLRIPRIADGLGAAIHSVERRSYGDFLLTIAVGLCFFLADGAVLLYTLPIAVLTLSDAAAALVGTVYGTRRFRVESGHKSMEGTVAFFVITLLVALISLMFLSGLPPGNILVLAMMVAAFGTLVEAQSWRGFDNLFLPLGILMFLRTHGQSSLPELLTLVALFLAALVVFRGIGPRFGLTTHAARVYAVAMFLILVVVEVQTAILPGLVLLAHAWTRLRNPCTDDFGDLDIVAALALFSFGWLALGEATGWNALQFYGLTAMGLAMGLGTLALGNQRHWVPLLALFLFAVHAAVTGMNPEHAKWAAPLWLLPCLCLILPAAAVTVAPDRFRTDRVMKLTLLSTPLPLGYYLFSIMGRTMVATNGAVS